MNVANNQDVVPRAWQFIDNPIGDASSSYYFYDQKVIGTTKSIQSRIGSVVAGSPSTAYDGLITAISTAQADSVASDLCNITNRITFDTVFPIQYYYAGGTQGQLCLQSISQLPAAYTISAESDFSAYFDIIVNVHIWAYTVAAFNMDFTLLTDLAIYQLDTCKD